MTLTFLLLKIRGTRARTRLRLNAQPILQNCPNKDNVWQNRNPTVKETSQTSLRKSCVEIIPSVCDVIARALVVHERRWLAGKVFKPETQQPTTGHAYEVSRIHSTFSYHLFRLTLTVHLGILNESKWKLMIRTWFYSAFFCSFAWESWSISTLDTGFFSGILFIVNPETEG